MREESFFSSDPVDTGEIRSDSVLSLLGSVPVLLPLFSGTETTSGTPVDHTQFTTNYVYSSSDLPVEII